MTQEEVLKVFQTAAETKPYGTQARIATHMSVTPSYVSQLIKGTRPLIADHVFELADLLGLEVVVREKTA